MTPEQAGRNRDDVDRPEPPNLSPDVDAAPDPVEPVAPAAPLLVLRDGLPAVVTTPGELEAAAALLTTGTGPLAVDAERASGYRYSQRA